MMTAKTVTQPSSTVGKPLVLFEGEHFATAFPQLGSDDDVSADGPELLSQQKPRPRWPVARTFQRAVLPIT